MMSRTRTPSLSHPITKRMSRPAGPTPPASHRRDRRAPARAPGPTLEDSDSHPGRCIPCRGFGPEFGPLCPTRHSSPQVLCPAARPAPRRRRINAHSARRPSPARLGRGGGTRTASRGRQQRRPTGAGPLAPVPPARRGRGDTRPFTAAARGSAAVPRRRTARKRNSRPLPAREDAIRVRAADTARAGWPGPAQEGASVGSRFTRPRRQPAAGPPRRRARRSS
jgi:hypothetical protein